MKDTLACFAKGFRTILAVLAFVVTGILGVLGSIDLTPVIALFVKDPALLGAAMVGVGVLFGYLRYLTTTPLFSGRHEPGEASSEDVEKYLKRDTEAGH